MNAWSIAVFVFAAAINGDTGSIRGTVKIEGGTRPAEIILYVVGYEEPPGDHPVEIRQREQKFQPPLVAVTAGQTVTFPNDDPFFHNVFSPTPSGKFDLGQYKRGETKTKTFTKIGAIDVFCNIHPEMAATVLVLPNRRFARAAADGSFQIDGVRPGRWKLFAYSRRAVVPASAPIEILSGRTSTISLSIVESGKDFTHLNKYGEKYRDPEKYR
jgi:plastocyanin